MQKRKKAQGFRDLKVWKMGMEIVVDTYGITKKFPKEEIYGIVAQMRRAAVSIPSNISEGFNRLSKNEYGRFLSISLGSCAELETQVEASYRLRFLTQEDAQRMLEGLDHESRMLRNLIKSLK